MKGKKEHSWKTGKPNAKLLLIVVVVVVVAPCQKGNRKSGILAPQTRGFLIVIFLRRLVSFLFLVVRHLLLEAMHSEFWASWTERPNEAFGAQCVLSVNSGQVETKCCSSSRNS